MFRVSLDRRLFLVRWCDGLRRYDGAMVCAGLRRYDGEVWCVAVFLFLILRYVLPRQLYQGLRVV